MISAGSRTKRKSAGQAAVNAHAVRAVVQILFATGKAYTIETLREKLREFFVGEGDSEKRAVAALSTVQLITALLEASPGLEALGLQIRLTNGTAQMFTGRIQNELLSAFIAERVPASSGAGELTQAALEVLSCIAFKQPITKPEIEQLRGLLGIAIEQLVKIPHAVEQQRVGVLHFCSVVLLHHGRVR